jgi:hypothetical protein
MIAPSSNRFVIEVVDMRYSEVRCDADEVVASLIIKRRIFQAASTGVLGNGYFSTKATSLQKAASPMLNLKGKQPIHRRMSSTSSIMPPAFSTWNTPCGNNW